MITPLFHAIRHYGPAALCRRDADWARAVAENRRTGPIAVAAVLSILSGAALYGFTFGIWRCPLQGVYSAAKMPLLIFSVTACSIAINSMLAQILGSGLSFRQVALCILLGLSITSILLGALSPVMLFFALQCPPPGAHSDQSVYRGLLLTHTSVVGLCGIAGHVRLYQLLKALTLSSAVSLRVVTAWILVSGLVGCELSWVLSPFLAKPDVAIPFVNPDAFAGNFFEYVWRAVSHLGPRASEGGVQ